MRPSKTWRNEGDNTWSVYLHASDKQNLQFCVNAREGYEVDFLQAEQMGWETMLKIMAGELPHHGSFQRDRL